MSPAGIPTIRPERPTDAAGIRAVHQAAFATHAEADLVDALRATGRLAVSLVATDAVGRVIGHVALSPVTVDGRDCGGLGLAPLAVLPAHQRRGVGGRLVRAALAAAGGAAFVVVLGDPAYYARFGFRRAREFGLANEYGVDDEFMAKEIRPDGLPPGRALVKYAPEFSAL
jgi:putative acetyltransferase